MDKQNLRLINFNPNLVYQLDELVFYIPKKYKDITPFLLIKDSKDNKDILKLELKNKDSNYNLYSVSLHNTVTIAEGISSLVVLLIDSKIMHSASVNIVLNYDNFTLGQKIYLIDELSKDIVRKYQQVEQMTKMNIDIYQSIEEGAFKL